jgi:hypothetical protein
MRSGVIAAVLMVSAAGSARADDFDIVGGISSIQMHAPDNTGEMQFLARGGGATVSMLCECDGATMGWEGSALFLAGDDGERIYDLAISGLASFEVERKMVVPFITFGLDFAVASLPVDGSEQNEHGVSLGLHGGVGLHGFVGDKVYWRGTVGYLGAGVNGLTGQLMLGYVFGSD